MSHPIVVAKINTTPTKEQQQIAALSIAIAAAAAAAAAAYPMAVEKKLSPASREYF
jgi:hypothetical protein